MCGISGIYGRRGRTADRRLLLEMAGELWHRGPDGVGLYLDGRFGMANNRLAIVDLEGGDQPLSDERGRYWVMQNGEIYNYVELRAELEQLGHRFATTSDTEVIAHAYAEWGVGCLDRLNGDFAIAIWDRETGEALLARDRFGVRPLFLAEYDGDVCFASEAKALLRHPSARRELDPVGIVGHVRRLDDAPRTLGLLGDPRAAPRALRRDRARRRWAGHALVGHRLLAGRGGRGRADRRGRGAAHRFDPHPAARGRRGRRLPERRARLVGDRRDRGAAGRRRPPVRVRARVRGRALRRERGAGRDRRASSASSSTGPWSTRPRSRRRSRARSSWPRSRCCEQRRPRCSVLRARCGRRGSRSCSRARRRTSSSPATTSSARTRCGASGRATRRRSCARCSSAGSTAGSRPTPRAPARSSPASTRRTCSRLDDPLYSHRLRFENTARSLRMLNPELLRLAEAEGQLADRLRAALPAGFERLLAAGQGAVRRDRDLLRGLPAAHPGRPDADGALDRGPLPVPGRPPRRARGAAAGLAPAARSPGEVRAAEGRRARPPRGDPVAAEGALPRADPRRLLRACGATARCSSPRPFATRACSTRRPSPGSWPSSRTGGRSARPTRWRSPARCR